MAVGEEQKPYGTWKATQDNGEGMDAKASPMPSKNSAYRVPGTRFSSQSN